MGVQTWAQLFYGVRLPDDLGGIEDLDDAVSSLWRRPGYSDLDHAWVQLDGGGGAYYLTASKHTAELGAPETVETSNRNVLYRKRLLADAWKNLGLEPGNMPVPTWYLAAYSG